MSLIIDKIKCVEESDEVGSDDIYLIGFIGRTVSPFKSALASVGPGVAWSGFDTGETDHHNVNTGLFSASDALYVVMMVEKDNGKDISGTAVVSAWAAQTDLIWKSIMLGMVAGGIPTGTESAKTIGFAGIKNALNGLASLYMEFPKGDDDVIDVKRVTITNPGQSQTIRFRSPSNLEDATYDVTFQHNANP
jgi:hypothetical protein